MKKTIVVILSILMSLSFALVGCEKTSKKNAENNEKTMKIVASFYPIYISLMNITDGIENVEISDMTKPQTGCLHDYSITTDDMKHLEDANIFVINGAGMESFMDKVTHEIPNLKVIEAAKDIELIKGEGDEGDNPHVWVSISENIKEVKTIRDELIKLDDKNKDKYEENADIYIRKLQAEADKMHTVLDKLPNRDIITFHEAFPYFAKEFNLNIASVIEREPGSEPSAAELKDTIDTVNKLKVKVLFAEPQYPAKAAESIANETGAKVYSLDPAVTGDMDKDAYINIMDKNLEVLEEALK